jgi:hypothetical protein
MVGKISQFRQRVAGLRWYTIIIMALLIHFIAPLFVAVRAQDDGCQYYDVPPSPQTITITVPSGYEAVKVGSGDLLYAYPGDDEWREVPSWMLNPGGEPSVVFVTMPPTDGWPRIKVCQLFDPETPVPTQDNDNEDPDDYGGCDRYRIPALSSRIIRPFDGSPWGDYYRIFASPNGVYVKDMESFQLALDYVPPGESGGLTMDSPEIMLINESEGETIVSICFAFDDPRTPTTAPEETVCEILSSVPDANGNAMLPVASLISAFGGEIASYGGEWWWNGQATYMTVQRLSGGGPVCPGVHLNGGAWAGIGYNTSGFREWTMPNNFYLGGGCTGGAWAGGTAPFTVEICVTYAPGFLEPSPTPLGSPQTATAIMEQRTAIRETATAQNAIETRTAGATTTNTPTQTPTTRPPPGCDDYHISTSMVFLDLENSIDYVWQISGNQRYSFPSAGGGHGEPVSWSEYSRWTRPTGNYAFGGDAGTAGTIRVCSGTGSTPIPTTSNTITPEDLLTSMPVQTPTIGGEQQTQVALLETQVALQKTIAAPPTSDIEINIPTADTTWQQTHVALLQTQIAMPTSTPTSDTAQLVATPGPTVPLPTVPRDDAGGGIGTPLPAPTPIPQACLTGGCGCTYGTPLPNLGMTIPTLRTLADVTATVQISMTTVVSNINHIRSGIQTPAAAMETSVAGYTWSSGEALIDQWETTIEPGIDWLAIMNPANPGYSAAGGPLWALAPVLVPILPVINVSITVLLFRFVLFIITWFLKLLDVIFNLIEAIPVVE